MRPATTLSPEFPCALPAAGGKMARHVRFSISFTTESGRSEGVEILRFTRECRFFESVSS
jgi:hypothetical protein